VRDPERENEGVKKGEGKTSPTWPLCQASPGPRERKEGGGRMWVWAKALGFGLPFFICFLFFLLNF